MTLESIAAVAVGVVIGYMLVAAMRVGIKAGIRQGREEYYVAWHPNLEAANSSIEAANKQGWKVDKWHVDTDGGIYIACYKERG